MQAFLEALLPRFFDAALVWKPIDYGSKQQLLKMLPQRLRGYAKMPIEYRPMSLVLVDRDDDDCLVLKAQLIQACEAANLKIGSTHRPDLQCDVINRIVIEELEAWYFGDRDAMEQGWHGVGRYLGQAAYRDCDAIKGGTHEALLRVLQKASHFKGLDRLPKIDAARTMGNLVLPDQSQSHSFQQFWAGLHRLIAIV